MPRKKLVPLNKLRKDVWKKWSEYIRSKDADWRGYNSCFTCGVTKQWREMDAGHYIHSNLDFDERNIKPQCKPCNGYYSGRLDRYAERLIRENGQEWVDQLRQDARDKGNKYTRAELEEIIEKVKG